MRHISTYEIGDRLWEDCGGDDEPFSAGRIVAISDSVSSSTVVYLLVMSDKDEFTIYSTLSDAICKPHLCRFIPYENMKDLFSVVIDGVELPDESPESRRAPKKKKAKEVGPSLADAIRSPRMSFSQSMSESIPEDGSDICEDDERIEQVEHVGGEEKYLPAFDVFWERGHE